MNSSLIASLIGTALICTFLLYYVISVRSVPLSIIIMGILLMVGRTLYDEAKRRRNNRTSQPPAPKPGNRHA